MTNFLFIRGERLSDQVFSLDETPYAELYRNVVRSFPATAKRQNATDTVQIVTMNMTPFGPTEDLQVAAEARNEGKVYNPKIMFLQVNYEDDDTDQNVTFVGSDGNQNHIQPISLGQVNCKVTCTCMDFYWRFALYNYNDQSLLGNKPPAYQRKTDNRQSVNPNKVPGVCKHLIKLVQNLEQTGIVNRA